MRILSLLISLFLLSAFTVGVSIQGSDIGKIELALDNATKQTPFNHSINTGDKYTDGMIVVIYDFSNFLYKAGIQTMRLGILFGYENPDYFTPEYVFNIIKLILILTIISLLIQPLFYLGAFLVIFIMWLLERIKKRRECYGKTRDKIC